MNFEIATAREEKGLSRYLAAPDTRKNLHTPPAGDRRFSASLKLVMQSDRDNFQASAST